LIKLGGPKGFASWLLDAPELARIATTSICPRIVDRMAEKPTRYLEAMTGP
jgi:hypothetical protein